jgi:hypothetical protein
MNHSESKEQQEQATQAVFIATGTDISIFGSFGLLQT